ncbi:hypothetical protein NDU88_002842 [Pleurodeles waltl]|uniref:Secreted protein n=1 Tax=Pleurodeles waltl TaxID=8319 RepID=A0AAV7W4A9_PLEWA|nr:hypothetical protein NDU88_002842 [Pleurodeles waltl]
MCSLVVLSLTDCWATQQNWQRDQETALTNFNFNLVSTPRGTDRKSDGRGAAGGCVNTCCPVAVKREAVECYVGHPGGRKCNGESARAERTLVSAVDTPLPVSRVRGALGSAEKHRAVRRRCSRLWPRP